MVRDSKRQAFCGMAGNLDMECGDGIYYPFTLYLKDMLPNWFMRSGGGRGHARGSGRGRGR